MKLIADSLLRHRISSLQRSVPPLAIVSAGFLSVLVVIVALVMAVGPPRFVFIWDSMAKFSERIPPWANAFVGLFFVVVMVGVAGHSLYSTFESFILFLGFGRSSFQEKLRTLAKQDFLRIVGALESDRGISRPFAVFLGIWQRLFTLPDLIRRLRNYERNRLPLYYRETVDKLKRGWQEGEKSSDLLRDANNLEHLGAPSIEDKLVGQTIVANITYLCGSLLQGRRIADRTMAEAEVYDGTGLPIYQWFASYPHANSRLFLGQFHDAALLLGTRWRRKYVSLSANEKQILFSELKHLWTVHPIASVPRHIILASAFAGRALLDNHTQPGSPLEPPIDNDHDWVTCWYETGKSLCKNESIELHFTHGYMSLYCLVVEQSPEEALRILDNIPPGAPPASRYVKDGVSALCYLKTCEFEKALAAFKRADSSPDLSGNTFLHGILLPAYGTAAARAKQSSDKQVDEIRRRAILLAKRAQSAFYDSLVDAFDAVVAKVQGEDGKFQRLKSRAEWQTGGLVTIYGLNQVSAKGVTDGTPPNQF